MNGLEQTAAINASDPSSPRRFVTVRRIRGFDMEVFSGTRAAPDGTPPVTHSNKYNITLTI
jgi:hypothetical protein